MYEYGMRLGQETTGLKSLQKQAKCYLAALNALRLVDPAYAWIVKPAAAQQVRVVPLGFVRQVSFTRNHVHVRSCVVWLRILQLSSVRRYTAVVCASNVVNVTVLS